MSSTITKAEKHLQFTQAIFGIKIKVFNTGSNEELDDSLLTRLMASFGDYCIHLNDRAWIKQLRQIQPGNYTGSDNMAAQLAEMPQL